MFETDDDDFTLSPSSKLSSIFSHASTSDDSNASLTYKAPKQPKPPNNGPRAAKAESNAESQVQPQSSVLFAKVITLWKLENGKKGLLGKYMVAIIGNVSQDLFEMIIYQEKTKITIREPLGRSLTFYIFPNNFLTFYDSQKRLWSLSFDSSDTRDSFLHLATKYNCVSLDESKLNNGKDERDARISLDSSMLISEKAEVVPKDWQKDSSAKEVILSRITKMGQSILPRNLERNGNNKLSDSETESSYSDSKPTKPVTAPRKYKRNLNNEKALAPLSSENSNNYTSNIPSNNNFLLPPNSQMIINPHNTGGIYSQPTYPLDYGLNNFIIAQNAELKANLVEINMKLNALSTSGKIGNNREDLSAVNSKIKCQNLKIDNLSDNLNKTRKALDELHKEYYKKCEELIAEQSKRQESESYQVEVDFLRERVKEVGNMQNTIEQLKMQIEEKDKELDTQISKLKEFEDYQRTHESFKDSLTSENTDLRLRIEELTSKLIEYEQKANDSSAIQDETFRLDKDKVNKIVKECMNEAFGGIMENFDENELYRLEEIQKVLLDNLKKTSFRLINSLSEKV